MAYLVKKMNDLLEQKIHYSTLFSYYGGLLTERQQAIFKAYYEEDYSLAEIGEAFGISRNAVHDCLKQATSNLEQFESVLHLVELNAKREAIYEKYKEQGTKEELIKDLKEME